MGKYPRLTAQRHLPTSLWQHQQGEHSKLCTVQCLEFELQSVFPIECSMCTVCAVHALHLASALGESMQPILSGHGYGQLTDCNAWLHVRTLQ